MLALFNSMPLSYTRGERILEISSTADARAVSGTTTSASTAAASTASLLPG